MHSVPEILLGKQTLFLAHCQQVVGEKKKISVSLLLIFKKSKISLKLKQSLLEELVLYRP